MFNSSLSTLQTDQRSDFASRTSLSGEAGGGEDGRRGGFNSTPLPLRQVLRRFREVLQGSSDLLPRTANLLHVFGNMTVRIQVCIFSISFSSFVFHLLLFSSFINLTLHPYIHNCIHLISSIKYIPLPL